MIGFSYALFKLATFVCTIVIDDICMQYCKCQLLHVILQLKTTFVCTTTTENTFWSNIAADNLSYTIDFCMYHYK